MIETNKVYEMDAFELLKQLPDKSVDLVLTDPPYGITACEWDKPIDLKKWWVEIKRIIKPNGAIVMTASQPFTTDLINSNREWFKYSLVWDKVKSSQSHLSKIQPMRRHEDILVFGFGRILYNPQRVLKDKPRKAYGAKVTKRNEHKLGLKQMEAHLITHSFPTTILNFSNADNTIRNHPTQKPIKLFKYLIKTYTDKNNVVLDCFVGSGTTAVACKQLGRNFICCDNNAGYVEIANKRLAQQSVADFTSATPTLAKPKEFNMGLEVSATPTPKSPSATSHNPNIKRNKFKMGIK